jgi:ring-1,2-phenylacetyl-CoA epoxidase subunit PaaD
VVTAFTSDPATPLRKESAPTAIRQLLDALDDVKDPEIPVVSVVELGIIQAVEVDAGSARIAITPTFLGCPALEIMRREIAARVRELGYEDVRVDVQLEPAWTTDRIAPAARERMKSIGLAPPPPARFVTDQDLTFLGTGTLGAGGPAEQGAPGAPSPAESVACPYCGSEDTRVESAFGPTICRVIHYCGSCRQSFEEFKAL